MPGVVTVEFQCEGARQGWGRVDADDIAEAKGQSIRELATRESALQREVAMVAERDMFVDEISCLHDHIEKCTCCKFC